MKASKKPASGEKPIVLAIDVGGSHVKILASSGGEEQRVISGPDMTAQQMIDHVKMLARGLTFDVISIGYPGPVRAQQGDRRAAQSGQGLGRLRFCQSIWQAGEDRQ